MTKNCADRSRSGFALRRALFAAAGAVVFFLGAAAANVERASAEAGVAAKSEKAKPETAESEKPKRVKVVQGERRPRGERRKKVRRRTKGGCVECGAGDGDLSPGVSIGVGAGGPVGGW